MQVADDPALDRVLALYAWLLGALFALSLPLSLWHRELGAVRNGQIALNAGLFLWLVATRRLAGFDRLKAARVSRGALRFLLGAAAFSFVACQLCRFYAFEVNGVDFSIFDWMLESTLRGRFMYSPIYDVNHFGIHPSYLLLPLVPLHAIFRTPLLLVVTTAALVWLGAIPCGRLARALTGSEAYGLLAIALYLTNPWVARLLDGGFRPEVGYPLFGLVFALGWVERRPRLWWLGALGLLSLKEDAGLYLGALALASLWLERDRRRDAGPLLALASAVTALDLFVVQPLALSGHAQGQPEYLRFWGQYGGTLGEITQHLMASPLRVAGDVLTSSWLKLFAPALLLPLLAPLPLAAMAPGILLLGASAYPMMRGYLTYYPAALVPFFLWGLFAAHRRLAGLGRWQAPLFTVALLLFPLVGDGYEKFGSPKLAELRALPQIEAELRGRSGPRCAQTVFFPHLSYDLNPLPLFPGCESRPGATLLIDPELDAWPWKAEALRALAAEAPGKRVVPIAPGISVVEPTAP